jgi:LuxR family maltose regulon positive regulatory protein
LTALNHPLVLILDDYHAISGRNVHKMVSTIILRLPPETHVIISSRVDPPIGLARLRAQGLVTEMRAIDMKFSLEETRRFFQQRCAISVPEAFLELIARRMDGWVAGLQLASINLRQAEDVKRVEESLKQGVSRNILDFMFQEVFTRQPQVMQKFMLRLAVLDEFNEDLCRAVIADEPALVTLDVRQAVRWMERANLFITALDDAGAWFRFHDLFRHMLFMRLEAKHGQKKCFELHRRASEWYAKNGMFTRAMQHALAAQNVETAAAMLEGEAASLENNENWPALRRWMDALPESVILSHPRLLLVRANISNVQGGEPDQSQAIEQANDLLTKSGVSAREHRALQGRIAALMTAHTIFKGDPQATLTHARQALECLLPNEDYIRGTTWIYYALAKGLLGESAQAHDEVILELQRAEHAAPTYRPRLMHALTAIARQTGSVDDLQRHAEHFLKLSVNSQQILSTHWAHYWSGVAHYERNELQSASEHFRRNVQEGRYFHQRACHDSYVGWALATFALGDHAGAFEIAQQLYESDLAVSAGNVVAFAAEARALMARLKLWAGDTHAAQLWAKDATITFATNPLFFLEVPALTKAKVLVASAEASDQQAAGELINRILVLAQRTHNVHGQIEAHALKALHLHNLHQKGESLNALRQSLNLASSRRYARTLIDLGPAFAPLLQSLPANDPHADYVRFLLSHFDAPAKNPSNGESIDSRKQMARRLSAMAKLPEPLTARELEILGLLAERLSYKEIASRLHISEGTVSQHINHIYRKLNVSRRVEAISNALSLGIL